MTKNKIIFINVQAAVMAGDEVAVVVEVDAATSAPRSQQRQNTSLHRRFYGASTAVLQYFNDTSSVVLQ